MAWNFLGSATVPVAPSGVPPLVPSEPSGETPGGATGTVALPKSGHCPRDPSHGGMAGWHGPSDR